MEDKNENSEPCAEISTDDLADLKRANADLRDTIKTLDKQLEFLREQAFVSYRTMPFFREWIAGEIAAAQTEEFEKVIESYNTDNNILPAEEVVEHVAENIDLDDAIDTYNADHDIRAADDIAHDVVQSLKDENEQNILDEDDVESIVARILDNVSITLSV